MIIYCAECGQPIAAHSKGRGPDTKEWVKPSSCPKCGKDIDYRLRIIVRDPATDTISLVREYEAPKKTRVKPAKTEEKKSLSQTGLSNRKPDSNG